MISEALINKCVNERIDAGVESDDQDPNDVGDVAVLLCLMVVVEHVDYQDWKPRDRIHNAHLKAKNFAIIAKTE